MKKIADLYRASYSGLSPSSWWLSVVMLINRSGTMVVPFMSLYLTQRLDYPMSKAGLVMALFGAGAICGGLLGGRLCGLLGFYRMQLLTLAGGGCMFFLLGQMRSFPLICITTFVLSLINESFRPANALAIVHYSRPEHRTRSYSLNRLAINLGWAAGGAIGGLIAGRNYHLLFVIDGCTNMLAAVLLRLFLAPPARRRQEAGKTQGASAAGGAPYRDVRYLLFSVLVVLYAYAIFQLFSTLPVYFRRILHLSERQIGLTMTANGLIIGLVEMVLIYRLEGRRPPMQYIKWGTVLVAASFLIFNVAEGGMWLAMLSTVIFTAGEMLSMPFMNTYWVSRTNEHNRSGYAGLYTVSWATAQVLGPGTGALLADKMGFTFLWWLIGGISMLTAAGFALLQRQDACVASAAAAEQQAADPDHRAA